ncbi:MAG: DotA/TraY family protein, partial [Pseudomonadota bacterium]
MMPAFAHIGPIFIRTIAIMFVQSGLLRPNHPATMYGTAKDMPRFKFSDLLGEAWYNLRTGDGITPYHYGLFCGVILMICLTITGFFLFILNLTLSTAQAQMFSHPDGIDTSLGGAVATPYTGTGMFDATAGNPDLAISILDKVLRQPYLATGGPLQNGLGPLIEFYNTALLVVAAIVVFWGIISIVIDTARTGQIGGGRNSIVWLPIRFIFAMGLMIPMANGFNGGQAIVMKLAEWGSNLGSQGWSVYVGGVVDETLLSQFDVGAIQGLSVEVTRLKLCEIVYNTVLYNSVNGSPGVNDLAALPADNRIQARLDGSSITDATSRTVTYSFGNRINESLCGDITAANPGYIWTDPSSLASKMVNFFTGTSPTGEKVAEFKQKVRLGHLEALYDMIGQSEQLACVYARDALNFDTNTFYNAGPIPEIGSWSLITLTVPGTSSTAGLNCGSPVLPACGSDGVYGDGDWPDASCINSMSSAYKASLEAAYLSHRADVVDHITDTGSGGFLGEVNARGWAAMGVWYHKISQLNSGVKAALDDMPTTSRGSLEGEASVQHTRAMFKPKARKNAQKKVAEVLGKYDNWWGGANPNPEAFANAASSPMGDGLAKTGAFNEVLSKVFTAVMGGDGHMLYKVEGTSTDTYPLAELTKVGDSIINKSMFLYGVLLAISVGGSLADKIPVVGTLVSGLADAMDGPIGSLLGTLAMAGLGAGMLLKYYVPLIPWIRVTFAVLAWIISVIEAVIVIPLLALANLNIEGDGLLAPNAKNMYVLGLNLLFRPIMIVIGFVFALLLFNTMVLYVNDTFSAASAALTGDGGPSIFGQIAFTIIYVTVIYSLANATFKLVDSIPNALMKWMGGPADDNYQDDQGASHIIAMGGATHGAFRGG